MISLLPPADAPPPAAVIRFADVTAAAGVDFRHSAGKSPAKSLPETMGAGVCLFDADGDGRLDLYFVDGGPQVTAGRFPPGPPDRLFANRTEPGGPLRFVDLTAASGLGDRGYGMGCAVGDVDNDGDRDLYVTNLGGNTLWRNDGRGRFTAVTAAAGVAAGGWSTSAAFADLDRDGLLDLYVARYVEYDPRHEPACLALGGKERAYCHPDRYPAAAPLLFHNLGGGRFRDVTAAAGIALRAGKGLGVFIGDLFGDGDGRDDIYGANDATINYLFRNRGGMRFEDVSLVSGAGYDGNGRAQAGMGVDAGDVDGDGDLDLFVTNLDEETNTLYANQGGGSFRDATVDAGLALPGRLDVGFGTGFGDLDQDGDLDLLIANGHVIDTVQGLRPGITYAQPMQVLANDGRGRFRDATAAAGEALAVPRVARGLALGDLDGDGDLDAVVTTCGGPALLLENRTDGAGRALLVQLRGTGTGSGSNRDGYGARLELESDGRTLVRQARSASSYLSQGDPRVHFGLGSGPARRLTVRWPSGRVSVVDAPGRADAGGGAQTLAVSEPLTSAASASRGTPATPRVPPRRPGRRR